MTTKDLHPLLDALSDTSEVVIRRVVGGDGHVAVWRAAAEDVRMAYADWCASPGARTHAAYLAAEDQSDAAFASLRVQAEPHALAPA